MTLVVVVRGTDPGIALRLVPWALLTGGSAMGLPGAAIACYWVENLALDVTRSWGTPCLWISCSQSPLICSVKRVPWPAGKVSLLYKVTWPRPADYSMILQIYVQFVKSNYSGAIIVFDGYENEPSTKVMTQMKRRGATSAPKVVFKESNAVSLKRDAFLTNNENKQALVNHLGIHLIKAGYQVKHASADADTLIAKTAIDAVQDQNVTLVADDTDLLCLLLFHLSVTMTHYEDKICTAV